MFLIDCGESIFERLVENGLLEGIDAINLMITHTHSDHIGSLGTLAMYSYYILKKPLNIVMKKGAKHLTNIGKVLDGFGCTSLMYRYVDEEQYDNKFVSFQNIRYMETSHCDELSCYGLLFTAPNGLVYYSGDTREIENVKALIESGQNIDKLYIDTTMANFPDNVHLYIGILKEKIPEDFKNKVFCMHINKVDTLFNNHTYKIIDKKERETSITLDNLIANASLDQLKQYRECFQYFQKVTQKHQEDRNILYGDTTRINSPIEKDKILEIVLKANTK